MKKLTALFFLAFSMFFFSASNAKALPTGLVFYWQFEDASENTLTDEMGISQSTIG